MVLLLGLYDIVHACSLVVQWIHLMVGSHYCIEGDMLLLCVQFSYWAILYVVNSHTDKCLEWLL